MKTRENDDGTVAPSRMKLSLLTIGALGVVFGDIGTSPLYAVSQIFFGMGKLPATSENVFGAISLIVWSLTVVVAFKYVTFVLRADNGGEGGVFALFALLSDKLASKKYYALLVFAFTLAAGLLFGDGTITPAISVLSAVEGLTVVAGSLAPFVVPVTVVLLAILFFFQSRGTAKVGNVFGPIIVIWFVSIAALGLNQVVGHPEILMALSPWSAVKFLIHTDIRILLVVMGFVMLSITGGEALFADMGHFGIRPIRLGWFFLVYPALLLNYLGQGALLLSGKEIVNGDIFYNLVPQPLLVPMIVLATAATIIASQAMISGAFSLASQAAVMKLFPMLRKKYTNQEHEGQIYIPAVNWSLFAGAILLVLYFKSSSNLASAYGLAVSGDMLVTSLAMILIARYLWHWKKWHAYALFMPLAMFDGFFLLSNSMKFFQGGFIPLTIGIVLYSFMTTWQWGKQRINDSNDAMPKMSVGELMRLSDRSPTVIPKTVIFLSRKFTREQGQNVPIIFQTFWNRFHAIPQNIIFLHVVIEKVPHMRHKRFKIHTFKKGTDNIGCIVSVMISFGYWEKPNVEQVLDDLARHHLINIDDDHREWLLYMLQERVHVSRQHVPFWRYVRIKVFQILMKNVDHKDRYFGLGNDIGLSSETIPIYLD
ncbi:MAG: KUP/HAK/KT family potassium transporter [Candidatus Moranbacteria bacterium]|nr:KUP/HAK/KT family potassium transporter [Candidatus Moranbacteria bacterium]